MRLSILENRVIESMAAHHPDGPIIRAQLALARVSDRRRSATGFHTYLELQHSGRHLPRGAWKTEHMPQASAGHPSLVNGARFVLWLADGYLSCLEGHTRGQNWPIDEEAFTLGRGHRSPFSPREDQGY